MNSGKAARPNFVYPKPSELREWITDEFEGALPEDAPAKAAARIRRAGRRFTYSAFVPPAVGVGLGIALSNLASSLPAGTYWTLAATLAALVVLTSISWRTIVAARSPATAALYYAAACLDRLRAGGKLSDDLDYLALVLPLLERQLLGDQLNHRVAGTRVARAHVAGVQAGLVDRVGEAETAWRCSGGSTGGEDLRQSIGRMIAVVALDGWFLSKTPAGAAKRATPQLTAPASSLDRVVEAALAKGTEVALGAAGSVALLLIAGRGA